MAQPKGSDVIGAWPEESREAAQLVIETHGEPHEATDSFLVWHGVGKWKRIVASKAFFAHHFPAPHFDSVECVVDYEVPAWAFTRLAEFDGSVVAERTAGELSARCHDEEANNLALNLAHDIVSREKSVDDARRYYAKEFLDYRRKAPTPYMEKLRFEPGRNTADADLQVLSEDDLQRAVEEGKSKSRETA